MGDTTKGSWSRVSNFEAYRNNPFWDKTRKRAMVNGNRKGKVAEREWAKKLTEAGFPARRSQQYEGGHDSADLTCPSLDPLLHNEVKARQQHRIYEWIAQAQADAEPGRLVYVAHKKNRQPWLVTMPGEDFLQLLQILRGHSDQYRLPPSA